jgi:putative ABC transport system permease protein
MNFANAILVGLKEIWAHKFRSMLTMLGIILGVASLVSMSALVKGMENGMKEALIAMGGLDKVLTDTQSLPPEQQHLTDQAPGRTMQDVYALTKTAPLLRVVSPEMGLRNAVMTRAGKSVYPSELCGAWPSVLDMNLHVVQHGRFFTALDEEFAANVVVIGTGIRDDLFGLPEEAGREIIPIGEIVNINGQPFTIVGMFQRYESELAQKEREQKQREVAANGAKPELQEGVKRRRGHTHSGGGWAFQRKNYTAYIPLNSMWLRFRTGGTPAGVVDTTLTDIDIKVASLEKLEPALQQARNVLLMTHRGIEDFNFRTQENATENINATIRNARMNGGLIAIVSLIVGGIGIMNIMLASITERVREIGIRKAIGASDFAIFAQILVESLVIALLGGIVGLGASHGVVHLLIMVSPTSNTPVITVPAMIVAFSFSAVVGFVAGLIPAVKASRLNPIQALRYD